jgi:uncharacterized membrane protein
MNRMRKTIAAAAIAGSMLLGGVIGAVTYGATTLPAAAATTAASPAPTDPGTAPPRKFVSNEDPTHEAGESAAREAQENAGQRPTAP